MCDHHDTVACFDGIRATRLHRYAAERAAQSCWVIMKYCLHPFQLPQYTRPHTRHSPYLNSHLFCWPVPISTGAPFYPVKFTQPVLHGPILKWSRWRTNALTFFFTIRSCDESPSNEVLVYLKFEANSQNDRTCGRVDWGQVHTQNETHSKGKFRLVFVLSE